jgi:hypothetical protein
VLPVGSKGLIILNVGKDVKSFVALKAELQVFVVLAKNRTADPLGLVVVKNRTADPLGLSAIKYRTLDPLGLSGITRKMTCVSDARYNGQDWFNRVLRARKVLALDTLSGVDHYLL